MSDLNVALIIAAIDKATAHPSVGGEHARWVHLVLEPVFGRLQQIFPDFRERRAQAFCLALKPCQGLLERLGLEVNLQGDASHDVI